MADKSQIEWTEATWNPIAGCSVVSPGCTNCYAMRRVAPHPIERCFKCGEEWGPDDEPWISEGCPKCGGELDPVCPECGHTMVYQHPDTVCLDWVIVGGESGDGARPMHPDWARSLRDQCATAGVPFFFKQWGEWKDGSDFMPDAHVVLNDGRHRESSQQALRDLDRDGSVMAANPTLMRRVGKHAAGRLLDGVEHNGMPGAR